MDFIIIPFTMISAMLALLMLIFVGMDIADEKKEKKAALAVEDKSIEIEPTAVEPIVIESIVAKQEVVPEATVAATLEEEMPSIVTQIDAAEADILISDDLAIQNVSYQKGERQGRLGIVNLGDIDKQFAAHDTVTLASLQEKKMLSQKMQRLKILADGVLSKPLTVKAEGFSVQAMKMIELTGGTVVVLKG